MLKIRDTAYYKVKRGQTLRAVSEAFFVAEGRLAELNGLHEELYEGQILKIPFERGNAYIVQSGDTKALLCGDEENFRRWNGTDSFFIGMRVVLPP